MPGVITTVIYTFITAWNEFMFALTFITSMDKRPLTLGLYNFVGRWTVQWQYLMAAAILALIPVVILFMFIEKDLVKGLAGGAVKGSLEIFNFQWHITNRCNLRCRHCYQENSRIQKEGRVFSFGCSPTDGRAGKKRPLYHYKYNRGRTTSCGGRAFLSFTILTLILSGRAYDYYQWPPLRKKPAFSLGRVPEVNHFEDIFRGSKFFHQ